MLDSIFTVLRDGFSRDPRRAAVILPGGRFISYGALDEESGKFAACLLRAGIGPGDRIAVQIEKSPQALTLYLACLRSGLVFVPVNTAYKASETAYILNDAMPRMIVCDPSREHNIKEVARSIGALTLTLDSEGRGSLPDRSAHVAPQTNQISRSSEDVAVLLYTSGTTGKAKGAMLSNGALVANVQSMVTQWEFSAQDVLLHCLPVFHAHGLFVATHCALLSGAAMLWRPRFEAEDIVKVMPHASVFMGIPTFYTRLLANPGYDGRASRSIRLFLSGSAPLPIDTFEAFRRRSGEEIVERYGMTETGIIASNPIRGTRKPGTVGRPVRDVDVRVADEADRPIFMGLEGEVQARGPNLFSGYWGMPAETAAAMTADGWFKTGDIGRFDAEGYLTLVARRKDIIITGGYNVFPSEVEAAIEQLGGVREAAVFSVPHEDFGEGVVALITFDSGSMFDEARLISELKSVLANYKVPKRVLQVDELPRNAMGKIQKPELRARFRDLFGAASSPISQPVSGSSEA